MLARAPATGDAGHAHAHGAKLGERVEARGGYARLGEAQYTVERVDADGAEDVWLRERGVEASLREGV